MNNTELTQLIRSVIKEVLAEFGQAPLGQCLSENNICNHIIEFKEKVLTEKRVDFLVSTGCKTLRLAKKVVVTPLAKDRLRHLNINLERI